MNFTNGLWQPASMTRFRVAFREEAVSDLAAIFAYILENTGSPAAAKNHVERLEQQCNALSLFPHRGIQRNDIRPGLRLLPIVRRSVIAYTIDANAVRITNIFHAGQDFEVLLRNP